MFACFAVFHPSPFPLPPPGRGRGRGRSVTNLKNTHFKFVSPHVCVFYDFQHVVFSLV